MSWEACANGFKYKDSRLLFIDIDAFDRGHANLVTLWRNQPSARKGFFSGDVVTTPDTHRAFLANRKPHDLLWIIHLNEMPAKWTPIGMASLTIDPEARTAETGRHFLAEEFQGRGLWSEAEWLLLSLAFDVFRLDRLTVEVFADNASMVGSQERMGWSGRHTVGVRNGREVLGLTYPSERWAERRGSLWAYVLDKQR